jgi:hypothetical protein
MMVVARLLDRGKIKGRTIDFHPEQDHFTIEPPDGGLPVRLAVSDLKALFFVRSLDGNRDRQDHRDFRPQASVRPKLWIEFRDGEQMAAWPVSPTLGKQGFYVLPTDSDSNVEKAWICRASIVKLLEGDAAAEAAKKHSTRRARESSASWPRVVQLR